MSYSKELITDLSQFLTKTARSDVRNSALQYISSISNAPELLQLLEMEDFLLERSLCSAFQGIPEARDVVLTIFVNLSAGSSTFAGRLIEKDEFILICVKMVEERRLVATKLLSNLSRHFPARMKIEFDKLWNGYVEKCLRHLSKKDDLELTDYLGYIAVNLTTIPAVRNEVADVHLHKLLPLTIADVPSNRKLIAVDILRNLSFDDELHSRLLDPEDEFLTAILAPLADEEDVLDDEEIQQLPMALQYWDKKREPDETIRIKIVETLYQLCSTKFGRTTLRSKGVYPILRELDKKTHASKDGQLKFLNQEHTLHALIGILIRNEADMEVPADLDSIRKLK